MKRYYAWSVLLIRPHASGAEKNLFKLLTPHKELKLLEPFPLPIRTHTKIMVNDESYRSSFSLVPFGAMPVKLLIADSIHI
jgi:hypothetical protein